MKALTNSLNGKLLSWEGSMTTSLALSFDLDSTLVWWSYQNSLFFNTIFFRSSNGITTGYIFDNLQSLKNSIADICYPSPEKFMKTKL